MNAAHLHLILNHAPVIGTAGALLMTALAAWKRSDDLRWASLVLWVLVALVTIPVFIAGDRAEDLLQDVPGIAPGRVSEHQKAAVFALVWAEAAGLCALYGLWAHRRRRAYPRWLATALLALGLLLGSVMARTAYLGGQIRHEETRAGWQPPAAERTAP